MAHVDTSSPSSCADGLIVGARGCGRRTLLSALAATASSPDSSGLYSLHLDTKYYTADVALQLRELSQPGGAPAPAAATAAPLPLPQQLQALILVFDAASRASFQALLEWHGQQQEALVEDCEIKLVVANQMDRLLTQQPGESADSATSSDSLPAWLQEEARVWCYSNGFEYVAAAAGAPSVDAGLQEEGEQQGVARVLHALQAHMWPSMVQKQRQQQQQPAAAANGGSSASSSGVRDQGPPSSSSSQSREPDKDAAPTQQAAAEAAAAPPAAAAAAKQSSQTDADGDDPFLGVELDSFEQLMHQVAGVRARLSGLPDDQRRAAAADLALKLSRMMGLPGGSEDEDEDEEGADSEDAAADNDVALAADARG